VPVKELERLLRADALLRHVAEGDRHEELPPIIEKALFPGLFP